MPASNIGRYTWKLSSKHFKLKSSVFDQSQCSPSSYFLMQDEIIVHCPRKLLIKIFSFLFALHDVVKVYFYLYICRFWQLEMAKNCRNSCFYFMKLTSGWRFFRCFSQNIAPGIVYQKYQALRDQDIFIFMFWPT